MALARIACILLLVLLAALAGCAAPAERPDAGGDGTPAASAALAAPSPAAAGAGHLHDGWEGSDRITVLDQEARVDGTGVQSGTGQVFRPEPGRVVPLGTARVEVVVSWAPGPTDLHGDVELLVKTAADRDFRPAGMLESGRLAALAATNDQNDLPHQALSGWAFRVHFHPRDGHAVNLQSMPVRLRAEAVRGLDVPALPDHPDRWQGRNELPILQAGGDAAFHLQAAEASVQGRLGTHAPGDGRLVLPGTREVVVTLSNDGPTPLPLGLSFHGADTFEYAPAAAGASSGASWEFRIPVRPEQADGPYALQSLWSFRVEVREPVEGGPFSGAYSIAAAIVR